MDDRTNNNLHRSSMWISIYKLVSWARKKELGKGGRV